VRSARRARGDSQCRIQRGPLTTSSSCSGPPRCWARCLRP